MQRLNDETWKNIFNNMNDLSDDEIEEFGHWIEIQWLESTDEWVLCYGYEVFEDGFNSEKEAHDRLQQLENK